MTYHLAMAYRDDLGAAHARIEALEARLAAVDDEIETAPALRSRIEDLEHRISELAARAHEASAGLDRISELLRSTRSELPSLTDHNRTSAPSASAVSGEVAGVLCPMCLVVGDTVEMRSGGMYQLAVWKGAAFSRANSSQSVHCPRCRYLGFKLP